jgi:hypothetical protein
MHTTLKRCPWSYKAVDKTPLPMSDNLISAQTLANPLQLIRGFLDARERALRQL